VCNENVQDNLHTMLPPCQQDAATFPQPAFDIHQSELTAAPGNTSTAAAH